MYNLFSIEETLKYILNAKGMGKDTKFCLGAEGDWLRVNCIPFFSPCVLTRHVVVVTPVCVSLPGMMLLPMLWRLIMSSQVGCKMFEGTHTNTHRCYISTSLKFFIAPRKLLVLDLRPPVLQLLFFLIYVL